MSAVSRWIREGCITGLIAYVSVAVFYAVFDLVGANGLLFTVNQLGQFMLRGPAALAFDAGITPISLSAILAYSAVHLVASLAIGVLVCRLVFEAELQPAQAQTALLFIVAGFAGTIAMVGIVSAPIREVLPWWSIMSANALAVLVAGSVMIRRHPEFLSRMTETVR